VSDDVLRFDRVCYSADSEHCSSLEDADFSVAAGETLLVRVDGDSEHAPVLDLALGLFRPRSGSVQFMGKDWSVMDAFEEAASRGSIGCVFETSGWISSLSVIQNIVLRERHHSHRNEIEIVREAEELAALAGLTMLSSQRPEMVRQRELRVCEWVRACMGDPKLIVMISPEREAASYALGHLIDLVERATSRSTAVLWLTADKEVWEHGRLCNVRRCAIEQERWKPLREGSNDEA